MPSETKLPDSVTGVIPTATMPTIAALRRMARILSTVRNFGVTKTATRMTTAATPMTMAVGSQSGRPPQSRRRRRRHVGGRAPRRVAHAAASWCITSRIRASSVHSACGLIAGEAPTVEGRDRVGKAQHLGGVGTRDDDAEAGGAKVAEPLVDLGARADVDAAGRLLEEHHLRLGAEPLADRDLLLVAAGQRADRRAEALDVDGEARRDLAGAVAFAPGGDEAARRDRADPGRGQVLADRAARQRCRRACGRRSSRRCRAEASRHGSGAISPRHRGRRDRPAAESMPASASTTLRGAAAELAGEADDLAGTDGEAHRLATGRRRAGPRRGGAARRRACRARGTWSRGRGRASW